MSQHDPASSMGASDPSPMPPAPPDAPQPAARGPATTRSIVPGLTLFCVNLALGAFLVVSHVWPQSLGVRSSSPSAPVATATFSADPIESPPAQETPVTIVLTPAPVTPTAASTQRARATPIPAPTATATPATPTPTSSAPTPTPTLPAVG